MKGRRIRVWVAVTFFQEIYMFFFGYTILDSKVSIWVVQLSINFTQKKWGYCLIKRNLWVEYCLISGAHFLDAPTGILARKVLWMWHWIREKAMVIQNARSLTNSLLNTSLTLCLADHTLKKVCGKISYFESDICDIKDPFFLSVVIEWSKTDKKS